MKYSAYLLIVVGISFILIDVMLDLLLPIGIAILLLGIGWLLAEQLGFTGKNVKRIRQ
jgi:hypothetical protein